MDELHLENQWRLSLGQSAVLTTNDVTPTPQPVIHVKQAQNASTNYTTFWLLIGLGIFLVFVSLISLIVLIIYSLRHNKALKEQANAPIPANWQNGNQAYPFQYPDPSTYMQTSMYISTIIAASITLPGIRIPSTFTRRASPTRIIATHNGSAEVVFFCRDLGFAHRRQLKVEPVTDPRTGASPVPTIHEPGKGGLRV